MTYKCADICSPYIQAEVSPADATNPGIPPASLSSFLRVKPSIQGAVLTDHAAAYKNPFYQSHLDTVDNVQPESLATAAVVIARALHSLAASPTTPLLQASHHSSCSPPHVHSDQCCCKPNHHTSSMQQAQPVYSLNDTS